MSWPRGVPGPTRVKSSLSSRVSMILLLCWRAYGRDHPSGQHHRPSSLSLYSTACREEKQAVVVWRGVKRTRTRPGSVAKFDFWGKMQKLGIRNSMTYRLPNSRKSNFSTDPPILYPVACAPQAWAAGAVFLLFQACLSLEMNAPAGHIYFTRPHLPASLGELWIH